jgi:hypothetical protein
LVRAARGDDFVKNLTEIERQAHENILEAVLEALGVEFGNIVLISDSCSHNPPYVVIKLWSFEISFFLRALYRVAPEGILLSVVGSTKDALQVKLECRSSSKDGF